ncbi:unnamed protein product, partial [Heterosigma akashiwo]
MGLSVYPIEQRRSWPRMIQITVRLPSVGSPVRPANVLTQVFWRLSRRTSRGLSLRSPPERIVPFVGRRTVGDGPVHNINMFVPMRLTGNQATTNVQAHGGGGARQQVERAAGNW